MGRGWCGVASACALVLAVAAAGAACDDGATGDGGDGAGPAAPRQSGVDDTGPASQSPGDGAQLGAGDPGAMAAGAATGAGDANGAAAGPAGGASSGDGDDGRVDGDGSSSAGVGDGAGDGDGNGDGDGDGEGSTGGTGAICPDWPYAARPFEGQSITATQVCSGLTFSEGPVWVASRGVLLFSDFQIGRQDENFVGRIVEHTPGGGCGEFKAGIGSNGLALDNDGKVLACRHDDQSVSTVDPISGETSVLVANYQGSAFSSPNDATMRSDGNLYFTDPAWQVGSRPELLPQRAYRRDPAGTLHVIGDIPRANGITLSPDERKLYVSDTGSVRVYEVASDGSTGSSSNFVSSGSDGMVVDCAGNLYITTGGVVRVYTPGGEMLGEIRMPEGSGGTTNVAFGGSDRRTLFITAQQQLHAVELAIAGYPY